MARIIKAARAAEDGGTEADLMSLTDIAAEARTVVLDARRQAARIVAEARVQADSASEAATKQGYDEGFARGQNDGYEDALRRGTAEAAERFAEDAAGLTELLERIVGEMTDSRDRLLHKGRRELLDFAVELAEKIVGRVAARDPAAAEANLAKALELADGSRRACVKVNPDQLEALRSCLPGVVESLGRTGRVDLVADAGISPGGVKVVCGEGEIDATIETQLAHVAEALLGPDGAARGAYRPVGRTGPAAAAPKQPLLLTYRPARGGQGADAPAPAERTENA
ncbi:MAG TPA: FliH/SctL family protein [Phycisphaerae bacterium]|nr:FliH/SctL family protein [Phycisphaerae bacterium]